MSGSLLAKLPLSLGVFSTTPATCGIMGLLHSGEAFVQTILGDVAALQNSILSAVGQITAMAQSIIGTIMGSVSSLITQLQNTVMGVLTAFISHLEGQFTGLINNLTVAVSQAGAGSGLASSGCGLPSNPPISPDVPCGNMASMFGSIMGLGSAALSTIGSKIGDLVGHIGVLQGIAAGGIGGITDAITSQIGSVMGSINGVIGDVVAGAAGITNMINSETAAIASAISDMIAFGAANALTALKSNQCANQVLSSVASPALLSHLL